jgi:predicted transposase YdaD
LEGKRKEGREGGREEGREEGREGGREGIRGADDLPEASFRMAFH